jgi:predicted DCC family thiol-disulfide oxidoreductase YuxK
LVESQSTQPPATTKPSPLILFDGDCAFCNNAVNFIRRNSPPGYFQFEPSRSEQGQALLAQNGLPSAPKTMVLIENGKTYLRSSATLHIAARLKWPWPIFSIFLIVPPFIRNALYAFVAANRHRWARPDTCQLPPQQ